MIRPAVWKAFVLCISCLFTAVSGCSAPKVEVSFVATTQKVVAPAPFDHFFETLWNIQRALNSADRVRLEQLVVLGSSMGVEVVQGPDVVLNALRIKAIKFHVIGARVTVALPDLNPVMADLTAEQAHIVPTMGEVQRMSGQLIVPHLERALEGSDRRVATTLTRVLPLLHQLMLRMEYLSRMAAPLLLEVEELNKQVVTGPDAPKLKREMAEAKIFLDSLALRAGDQAELARGLLLDIVRTIESVDERSETPEDIESTHSADGGAV